MPSIPVSVLLKRGEECHFMCDASLHQFRTVTKQINYGGITASMKIMKGVRLRAGSVSVERVTSDVMTRLDAGQLYITTSRLLFDGVKKNMSISLGKITRFTVHHDGIKIERESGLDQYFVGSADWELGGACLDTAIGKLR